MSDGGDPESHKHSPKQETYFLTLNRKITLSFVGKEGPLPFTCLFFFHLFIYRGKKTCEE